VLSEYRQQVLVLHSSSTDLVAHTVAWALYDGAAPADALGMRTGDGTEPPYDSVVAAMRDGWRVIQVPQPTVTPGWEHQAGALPFQFVLTRDVAVA
jgi:hypothetical protein